MVINIFVSRIHTLFFLWLSMAHLICDVLSLNNMYFTLNPHSSVVVKINCHYNPLTWKSINSSKTFCRSAEPLVHYCLLLWVMTKTKTPLLTSCVLGGSDNYYPIFKSLNASKKHLRRIKIWLPKPKVVWDTSELAVIKDVNASVSPRRIRNLFSSQTTAVSVKVVSTLHGLLLWWWQLKLHHKLVVILPVAWGKQKSGTAI